MALLPGCRARGENVFVLEYYSKHERMSVVLQLEFTYRTHIDFEFPATDHYFTLRCLPRPSTTQHMLASHLSLYPEGTWSLQRDGFGNLLQVGVCRTPHSSFSFQASGRAAVNLARRKPETCHPCFTCFSPLTQPSPAMREFLAEQLPKDGSPLDKADALMRAVYRHVAYTPGATNVATTAAQAFDLARGVCQDEAQILITLCRMAGIPARYACGFTVGEGATHAWVQIYSDDKMWYGMDPTRNQQVDETYLTLAVGRDYQDCPVDRGVLRGGGKQAQSVYMRVQET